ncbi:DUF6584 family protein [Flavobacterium subsaxonicum]|uniref:Uncharacterized protein n=1 Tax=Flavobacterium subsaxonicum WB 4.1-42 = DSM 21790 TaxID=1121898 RepID=A0A0A2MMA5_9FLAO|nr:DUF6584 family protein [Flavobacterium subsaxonicum]KGO93459.1 hypothetical protein Q766_09200 [Flavobacterium subsaxonicum WB 4.1-42 = DSM 21790]
MDLQNKLDIIDIEIAKGLKQRAADRLRNLQGHYPDELIIWYKLAELYYESGFLDAAGKYWILAEPTEERIKKCVEIYEKSVNYSGNQILKELVFRGDKSKLPVYAQHKIEALEINSKSKVGTVPTYTRKHFKTKSLPKGKYTLRQNITEKLIIAIVIFIIISILLGFANGVSIIWNFLFK